MTGIRSLLLAALLLAPAAVAQTPAQAAAGGWTTYHLDNTRDANDSTEPAFSTHVASGDWTFSPSTTNDDEVFASPVVYGGHVFVATEANVVYAVDETTGVASWSKQVATPVPGNTTYIGCSPAQFGATDGITGTPVIDASAGIIYVVAMTPTAAAGHLSEFVLYGLRTSDGSVVLTTPLTDTNLDPKYQNERGALGLANGYVYVVFGGRDGDCGTYHPWVMAAPTAGGTPLKYQPQTTGQNEAGIWAPSGMAIDGSGNVYVETGNGSYRTGTPCATANWDHGDAVLKLSGTLSELDYFAPYDWCALNQSDTDLGSVAPMLIGGSLIASGKSGSAWVRSLSSLGHFGGSATASGAAGVAISGCGEVVGGMAYAAGLAYLPCQNRGVVALNVNTGANTWTEAWGTDTANAGFTFTPGAPILAGGVLWDEDQGGGNVYGFDPATGAQKFHITLGGAHRFTTLAADGGRLFAMLGHGVQSFAFSTFTVAFTAYLPWYDRISDPGFIGDDVHVVNPGGSGALVNVKIPGSPACAFLGDAIPAGQDHHYTCPTGLGGPVVIEASARVIASQRVQYNQSFNEEPAQAGPGSTDLFLAWYDLASDPNFRQDDIHVVNPGGTPANVTVSIGGAAPCATGTVGAGADNHFACPGAFGGPLRIHSDQPVLASARVKYGLTFNEVPARPAPTASRLVSTWYDHASSTLFHADNVHIFSTAGPLTPAQVTSVSIPSCASPSAYQASAAELVYSCPLGQGFGGPVVVQATTPVLVSQRVQYGSSFNEAIAQDPATGGTPVWMSWYDHASSLDFQADNLHVMAATAGSLSTSQVAVSIVGCTPTVTQASPTELYYSCPFGQGYGGPVKVTSTVAGGVLVSQRVQFASTFNEVNGST